MSLNGRDAAPAALLGGTVPVPEVRWLPSVRSIRLTDATSLSTALPCTGCFSLTKSAEGPFLFSHWLLLAPEE